MKTCICCKKAIEGQKCNFCGFMNIAALDENALRKLEEKAAEHRKSILGSVTDIRVVTYSYKVSTGKPVLNETNYITLAQSGSDCYEEIVWSDTIFAPNPGRKKDPRELTVQYQANGEPKELKVSIPLDWFDDMWSVGVMILKDMTVQFFLGNGDNYTASEVYTFEL